MLANLFRELYKNEVTREKYIESIPTDIRAAFFDNTYTNSLIEERDILVKKLFGDFTESIEWFLMEWKPGYEVGMNGKMTTINNIEEYISWMQENEGFPKD